MSAITDWAAAEKADLTSIKASLDAVVTGVKGLDDKIVALEAQLATSGTLSAEDLAALADVKASSAAVVSQASAIDTALPSAGTQAPAPAPAP